MPQKRRLRWRTLLGLSLIAGPLLAALALLWPGWPLQWLTGFATGPAAAQGLQVSIEKPWLRLHLDGSLRLQVSAIKAGDTPNPEALVLEELEVRWALGRLFKAHWLPSTIALGMVGGHPCTDKAGAFHLITGAPAPKEGAGASPAEHPFTLGDLPETFLPPVGEGLTLEIRNLAIPLPKETPLKRLTGGPMVATLRRTTATQLELGLRTELQLDQYPCRVDLSAQGSLAQDWLGALQTSVHAATTDKTRPCTLTLSLERREAGAPVALDVVLDAFEPGQWLPLLGNHALPEIEGQVSLQATTRIDPKACTLHSAKLTLNTSALQLKAPELLSERLTIKPVALILSLEDEGRKGSLAPFEVQAGPVSVGSTGVSWQTKGQAIEGTGQFHFGALPLQALFALLPETLRPQIPLSPAELTEIELSPGTLDLTLHGSLTGTLPQVAVHAHTGFRLNRGEIAFESTGSYDPTSKELLLSVHIPDFVAARWQLTALQKLPLPDLDAPLRADLSLKAHLPGTLDEARWKISAGAGHLNPRGPSSAWLAHPFPLSSFTLSGHLDENAQHFAIEQLELSSGRAQLSLERVDLRSAQSLLAPADKTTATAGLTLRLKDWYASDFLPLLGDELRPLVAPYAEDLAQLGLENLEASAEITFAERPWTDPQLTALKARQTARIRVGTQSLPLDVEWKLDRESKRVIASARLRELHLDLLHLSTLKAFSTPLGALDLPLSIELEISTDPQAKSLAEMQTRATLGISAGKGRIRANPWLAAELPVEHFTCSLTTRILPFAVDALRVEANFGGPSLLVDDTRVLLENAPEGGVHVILRRFPLEWIMARVPAAHIPEAFRSAKLEGMVEMLDLRASFGAEAGSQAIAAKAFALEGRIQNVGLQLPARPGLALKTLTLAGNQDSLVARIDQASSAGVSLHDFSATLEAPLLARRRVHAEGDLDLDLQEIPPLLVANSDLLAPQTLPDLKGLSGQARVHFTAQAPLDPETLGAALQTKSDISAEQLTLPLLPEGLTLGKATLKASVSTQGATLKASYELTPKRACYAPWLDGTLTARGEAALTPQGLVNRTLLDLSQSLIEVPELCWTKRKGMPASLGLDTSVKLDNSSGPLRLDTRFEGLGLVCTPLQGSVTLDLSDATHPEMPWFPGLHALHLKETQIGRSQIETLEASLAPGGPTQISLRVPFLDLTEWTQQLEPTITTWSQTSAREAAKAREAAANKGHAPPVVVKTLTTIPAAQTPLAPLQVPDLRLALELGRMQLSNTRHVEALSLSTELRGGFLKALQLEAKAGPYSTLSAQLADTQGRQAWSFKLANFSDWFAVATSPLGLLPVTALPPDSLLTDLKALPVTFEGGEISLSGTLDWADPTRTIEGQISIKQLLLQKELNFLDRIAGLVNRKVLLRVPFKVFEVASFTANPGFLALNGTRLSGPLELTSDRIHVDLDHSTLDMNGKVLGIGFEVNGLLSDPRFYLSERNQVIKGLTTEDDFDFSPAPPRK